MNDLKALNECVSRERWQVAQAWERDHWLRNEKQLARYGKNYVWRLLSFAGLVEKSRGNDRNDWWEREFDHYHFLPSRVENALEVGCGPYTNMRKIQKVCSPKHVFLSDPLIRTYLQFKMNFVSEMFLSGRCYIDDHPLEELPFAAEYFDVVVMINVLDHVCDANLCMKRLLAVVRQGGVAIIGQDLTNQDDAARHPEGLQIGHPITLDQSWLESRLTGQFDTILSRVLPRERGWAPEWHYGTFLFAGRKR